MGVLSAVGQATTALGGYRRHHVLRILFFWNLGVFLLFVMLYRFWGLKHVELPAGSEPSWHNALYMASITHYSFTPPYEPQTSGARALVAMHATMAWIPLFLVIFAPGSRGSTKAAAAAAGGGGSAGYFM